MKLRARFLLAAALAALPVAATAAPAAGTVWRDCPECPELVAIPPGRFVMGRGARRASEGPERPVTLERPFALGRYEVTFDEWQACVDAGGCARMPDDHTWGRGRHPVINVTFDDGLTYLRWLSARTGFVYRLPSEAEWDYANRAGTATTFWWGDAAAVNRANCRDCGSPRSGAGTAPVGSFAANAFGVYDTSGNVWEWVADCWSDTVADVPAGGQVRPNGSCRDRVIRGGAWYFISGTVRAAARAKNDARAHSYTIGFRVARDLP
jgi:formylglycine-generating enzyme required for sulfatase activity